MEEKIKKIILILGLLLICSSCGAQTQEDEVCVSTILVEINPSFKLLINSEGKVLDVIPQNEDAEEIMDGIVFKDGSTYRYFEDVMDDILTQADNAGYIKEKTTINITILETESNASFNEDLVESFEEKVNEYSKDNDYSLISNFKEEESAIELEVEDEVEHKICATCNGKGVIITDEATSEEIETACVECNGTGKNTRTLIEEEEVRNSYVCPYCGNTGVLDDGMHGGKTAECGYCTTSGGTREWNELAYDKVQIERTIVEDCNHCNGTGKETMVVDKEATEITCPDCNGTGLVE